MPYDKIATIIGLATTIVLGGYYASTFYNDAIHAHEIAVTLSKTVEEQQQTITTLRQIIDTLNATIVQEREVQELEQLRANITNLPSWQKARYCELFRKYRGDVCDAP